MFEQALGLKPSFLAMRTSSVDSEHRRAASTPTLIRRSLAGHATCRGN